MNLAQQLERSAQIPLATLITIGLEVQITRDQCERLASKSLQLEGEHEVAADLVIRYDLAMVPNQLKLTADWFAHRMGATLTPAAATSKKRAMQELKDKRALGGKEAYQSIATWQQTAPHLRGPAPLTNPAGAAGRRTASLRTQAGAGERTSPLPRPPASNPGSTHHPLEAAELYTPSGREYAAPRPGPVRVLYTSVPHPHAQMNTHVRSYVHDHGPKPAQTHGGLVYAQNEHHAHTASKKRAMQEGPTRSGWKGLVPVNFPMATDRPHIPVVQPHSPIQMGWGTGAPTRVNQPIIHSQRALPPRATSVVNPDTSSATAPTRTLRQTTAAVPGCKEGPG